MRKHCPFAFSGLPRRLLAPQDRPFLLFPLSFPPYHQTTVTPQAPPAKRTHANSRRFFRPLHPSLRMDDKKARLPAGKRTFSSVQFWDYCRFAQNLPGGLHLEAVFRRPDGELHAGAELELLERVLDVNLHRSLGNAQALGDLEVRDPRGPRSRARPARGWSARSRGGPPRRRRSRREAFRQAPK